MTGPHFSRWQQTLVGVAMAVLSFPTAWGLDVTTFHYDNQRTGANTAETVLNQSNVSAFTFGKLYERAVSGDIFAQPLYLAGVTIGGGTHNVIYVATENNYVYCFDADDSATAAYWTRSDLGAPAPRTDIIPGDTNYNTVIGITSTPVIDRASGTIYTVSMNKDAPGVFNFRLWAMDLATGANKTGSPTVITATNFDPVFQAQRAALTLANGKIYVAFASFSDKKPYSGYIISYNPATLAKVNEFLTGPSCVGAGRIDDYGAGIWMSGCGPAVDAGGNLYVVTGNGAVNTTGAVVAGTNYGESIVKLDQNLGVLDFYTPFNRDDLNITDADLGVGGLVVLPDQSGTHAHMVVHGSKRGILYVEDRDSLGKYVFSTTGPDTNIVQAAQAFGGNIKATPIYWVDPANNHRIIAAAEENQPIKSFVITGTGALDLVNNVVQSPNFRGTQMSLSSNGNAAGTGVLWAFSPTIGDPVHGIGAGVLHAYNAETLAELYNSTTNSIRDDLGNYPKNCPPLVVGGKLYAATFSNKLCVYGPLPVNPSLTATITSPANNTTTALEPVALTITATATTGTGTISKVGFYQGTTLLGEDTTAPYSLAWTATAGTYSLTALATDNNGASAASTAVNITVPGRGSGTVLHQTWTGIGGNAVTDLTGNAAFPNSPNVQDAVSLFEGPTNGGDTADPTTFSYGSRIIGYLYPPVTGAYTFWIASDDNSELWLSTDSNPVNRVKIATVPQWTGPREWTKFTAAGEQQSVPVTLTAGQIYFIEALQKEGGGGDNFAVGWSIPTSPATLERPILGVHLSPPTLPPTVGPPAGSYSGPVTVHLAEAIPGLTIHYTTDGSTPTAASPTYTTPFVVPGNATTTVKAVTVMVDNSANAPPGTITSAGTSAVFTVTGNTAYGLPERPALTGVNLPANLGTNPPALLSQTGLFTNTTTLALAPGVIPYDVISPLWSDGANKDRYIALPTTGKITFAATGEFIFPAGTVLIKNFKVGTQRLELRLLVLNGANAGYGITYKWNAGGTDANLMGAGGTLADGLDEAVGSQTWHYPSRAECLLCHTAVANFVLGPKARQLNSTFAYPGGASDNQLRTWNYLQMFGNPITEASIPTLTKMVSVSDGAATLENRVRSYLDSNCAQCHRPGGADAYWDARYDTAIGSQGIIDGAVKNALGVIGAEVVRPQDLSQSLMRVRMNSVDPTIRMPPLARNLVDANAVSVLDQWIMGLPISPTVLPAPPSVLTATASSATQIALAWTDNANNETGFRIERKTGAGGTYAEITVTGGNLTAFNDSGLAAGTLYYYRVRATNGAGNSAYSNEASATTSAGATAPAAPSVLTATASSATQIALAWTDNANNETGFRIERKTGAGGTYAEITVAGANLTAANDSGLTAGTLYYYRMRATNGVGDSAYSNEASATTSATGGGGTSSSGGGGGGCGLGAAATAMLLGFAWILGRQLQLRSGR